MEATALREQRYRSIGGYTCAVATIHQDQIKADCTKWAAADATPHRPCAEHRHPGTTMMSARPAKV